MTFDEFLKLLRRAKWKLDEGGSIRRRDACYQYQCPWLFVSDLPTVEFNDDSDTADRWKLWDAADNEKHHDPEIRRRLLEACGLEKERA